MEVHVVKRPSLLASLGSSVRNCIYLIISKGPIPCHLAFIMDGNRRFAKKEKLDERSGYRAGFSALMSMLKYCYELGVRYVTIYAFSIDNFRRRPDEIQRVMDLILEKTEGILKEESLINTYGSGDNSGINGANGHGGSGSPEDFHGREKRGREEREHMGHQ